MSVQPKVSGNRSSRNTFRDLYLECFDQYVYNDLPQYLLRTHDMKLVSRDGLCSRFRSIAEDQVKVIAKAGKDVSLNEEACKNDIRQLLKFAIFSHRWGRDEPLFDDLVSRRKWTSPKGAGHEKLRRFCEVAKEQYCCEYVWSDTCCIKKESSADLDEAIRSMFRWYTNAYVCIVHLAESYTVEDFPDEPWFTRGWTLQELLAAKRLRMFGKDWSPICPRREEGRGQHFAFPNDKQSDFMLRAIQSVTDIRVDSIRSFSPADVSVAERMRWASKRKTTRVEDIAYSLLGIFDVSIPIAYGEGSDRAFRRLLNMIAQSSHDVSLFAWSGSCSRYSHSLPSSPACYTTAIDHNLRSGGDSAYTIQKRGVQLRLLVIEVRINRSSSDRCTLEPVDAILASKISMCSGFSRNLQRALDDGYVVGVVDYDLHPTRDDVGHIKAGGNYFGMILERSRRSILGFGLCARRQETNDPLLTIECNCDHEAELVTVCVLH